MSWMAKLYATYEAAMSLDLAGDRLLPISHTLQNAHIRIVLGGDGRFRRAEVLKKTQIVLPATEESAGRTSGEAPHPLADKIQYVAADYPAYGGKKKPYFASYLQQLTDWCESSHAHPKIRTLRTYVARGEVVKDLVAVNVLHVNEHRELLVAWPQDAAADPPALFKVLPKEKGQLDQGSALVCWSVESDGETDTWEDQELQTAWVAYQGSEEATTGLCYVTGKQSVLATSHPAKLRHTGDKAKLVSANDLSGYTFRGRFTDTKKSIEKNGAQSVGVGYDVTQKAHNALRWLVSRQGFRNGDQAVVAWAISGAPIPPPLDDPFSFLFEDEDAAPASDTAPALEPAAARIDHSKDLGQSFSTQLRKVMAGYQAKLGVTDNIAIMAIDSATPGRMAVTYYQELFPADYIARVSQWHEDFAWFQRRKRQNEGKKGSSSTIWPLAAPSPKSICEAIYGKMVSDSLRKNTIERILPCIVEARPFPRDLLVRAVRRVSNRVGYKKDEWWLWETHLGVACALFRGCSKRQLGAERAYGMGLEQDNESRDYLYGRLLAVAERMEEVALFAAGEKRSTTAARLMHRFADRPASTWRNIELALLPYIQRLKSRRAGFLHNAQTLLDEVVNKFAQGEFTDDKPLSGEFLLAFHCQRLALRNKKSTGESESEHEQTEGM